MASVVYKILWFFLHYVAYIFEVIYWLGVSLITKFNEIFLINQTYGFKTEKEYIQHYRSNLSKLPEHLVIILGTEKPNFEALSCLVSWSSSLGVRFISFYDHRGALKADQLELLKFINKEKKLDEILWGPNLNKFSRKNGYNKENRTEVNFFCPKDGKQEIVSLCQQFGMAAKNDNLKIDEITVELIDKKLRESLGGVPDPDLALYFGGICGTYGLLPWQIRLTEFLSLGRQSHLRLNKFLNVIDKYASCQQRLGK